MKKAIVFLFIFMFISITINEKENIIIPKDAIRFRIIANSNSIEDQNLKLTIKSDLEKELYQLLESVNNIDDARTIITNNIDKVDNILNKYNVKYEIHYGNNFFPNKEYKGIKYNEGYYESLVIKLGSALGDNWWCVLFPPLCQLDEDKSLTDKEYRIFVFDLINKIDKN